MKKVIIGKRKHHTRTKHKRAFVWFHEIYTQNFRNFLFRFLNKSNISISYHAFPFTTALIKGLSKTTSLPQTRSDKACIHSFEHWVYCCYLHLFPIKHQNISI